MRPRGRWQPFLAALSLACARAGERGARPVAVATPSIRFVETSPGVRLEIVDWGGTGPPMVFLAGLGNSAHVFDEFAPLFTARFHAIGITRRGFGASATAPAPHNLDTLVADVRAVLDTLSLRSVTVVGHSIAGEEMTRFGETSSARCTALVYLDAAYDRTDVATQANEPASPPPHLSAGDTATFASIEALYARVLGVREPESEIRATARFDAHDHYRGQVTPDSMKARIAAAERTPRYDRVACPSLAIYAFPASVSDVLPYYAELGPTNRARGDTLLKFVASLVRKAAADFSRYQNHQAAVINGNHYIFLERPRDVAKMMSDFLSASRQSATR